MSEKKSIIDSPFAKWVLAIATIAGVAWGFYGNYHNKSPRLLYEIQSRAVLFNRTDAISSVRFYVDTLDVLNSNQNISVFTFKVSNKGSKNLTSLDYDDGAFGIKVFDGEILNESTCGSASNEHILERYQSLSPSTSSGFVEIPRIALDKEDWYSFSFAVLHGNGVEPKFQPVGKVIGQKEIEIIMDSTEKLPLWSSVFYGDAFANVFRLLVYLIILVLFLLLIASITIPISESSDKRKHERIRNQIARNLEIQAFVRDDFNSNEDRRIRIAEHYYGLGENRLSNLYSKTKSFISIPQNIDNEQFDKFRSIYKDINLLLSSGYLMKDNENDIITIPRETKESVHKVKEILDKNKYNPYKNRLFAEIYNGIEIDDIGE